MWVFYINDPVTRIRVIKVILKGPSRGLTDV